MSKKDFKEGMIAGAKPFEDKFREVQNANIAALQKLASENANEVGELIDIAEEHDYLLNYNWKQDCQLGSLAEKSILIGFLMDAINKISTSDPSDNQKEFLNQIYRFLKLNISALFSKTIDISYLSNSNDVAFQKLLYLLTCIYFYLENENFEFEKNNPDVFDYFNVSPRDRKDIQGLIEERGKYFDLDSLFAPVEEEVAEIEAPMEEDDNAVGCNLPDGLEEKCFDELYMVKNACEDVIIDKIINIQSNFHIDGKLTFKNCKINAKKSCQINVTDSGVLEFDNCEFSDLRRTENYLINSKGKVNFNYCTIYNCWKLALDKSDHFDSNNIEINKSLIQFDDKFNKVDGKDNYCRDNTLFNARMISFLDSKVEGFMTPKGEILHLGRSAQIFSSSDLNCKVNCSRCSFNNIDELFVDNYGYYNLSNCHFNECFEVFNDVRNIVITNCDFSRCMYIFHNIGGENRIENCRFIDCCNSIFLQEIFSSSTYIEGCEFKKFKQLNTHKALFYFFNPDGNKLRIKHCIFDDIYLAEYGSIIYNEDCFEVKSFYGEISECTFGKIIRKTNNPVIKQYATSHGQWIFSKDHTYRAYTINNCTGLDGLL